jgi:murein DD-endopeptidase MepM/ murein hydrolase activator NlpD
MDANLVQMLARSAGISLSQGSYESPERLQEVATEFEAMVIHQLLRQMREASRWLEDEDDDLFGDGLLETIDVELAKQLAMGGGLGLSDSLMPMLMDGRTGGAPYTPARPEVLGDGSLAGAITSRLDASPRALTTPPTGVTSQFGWRQDPIAGDPRFHAGVDLHAAYGREVGAAQRGRVVRAGEQGGYGLTVVVEHRPGVQTRYAHLSSILVAPGEMVDARQTIGRAGQTGRATGTHVHFEVTLDGEPVDPGNLKGGLDGLLEQLRLSAE